jgi:DtxR family Mn-dependent transcriptional regulator
MASRTIENYLKQLYLEEQSAPGEFVPMGRLATLMSVVPGTATAMVKALSDSGLAQYEPRGGVRLTAAGMQLALHVLRRHRLVELFLVQTLQLDWSEVHAEAEELEHVISDKVLDRIDALLGHPEVDPHGDPIPTRAGDLTNLPLANLNDCPLQTPLRIARVLDQTPAFLQFVQGTGLTPGTMLTVQGRDVHADAVSLHVEKKAGVTTVSTGVGGKFLVREA